MAKRQKYWEDFKLGDKLTTAAVTVTETHIVNFAGLTLDYYPLHTNEEYAKKTQFGGRIAHGPLTFCLAVGLVGQTGVFADSLVAFLGVERLRLLGPVRAGDTIHVEAEVTNKRETSKPERGLITMTYNIVNQRGESVATVEMNFMMHRRMADG